MYFVDCKLILGFEDFFLFFNFYLFIFLKYFFTVESDFFFFIQAPKTQFTCGCNAEIIKTSAYAPPAVPV